jgi:hypothetical protein
MGKFLITDKFFLDVDESQLSKRTSSTIYRELGFILARATN